MNMTRTELLSAVLDLARSMGQTAFAMRRVHCEHCGRHVNQRIGNVVAHEGELIRAVTELPECYTCGHTLEVLGVEFIIRGKAKEAIIQVLSTSATRSGDMESPQEVNVILQDLGEKRAGDGVVQMKHYDNTRTKVMPGNRMIVRHDRQLTCA